MKTQNQELLAYLKRGHEVSVTTIMRNLHIGDPRARIRDLRDRGHNIASRWVKHRSSRTGRMVRYCVYKLVGR